MQYCVEDLITLKYKILFKSLKNLFNILTNTKNSVPISYLPLAYFMKQKFHLIFEILLSKM